MANEPVPHTEGAITQPAHLIKELSSLAAPQTRPGSRTGRLELLLYACKKSLDLTCVTRSHTRRRVHARCHRESRSRRDQHRHTHTRPPEITSRRRDKELEIAKPQTQPEPDSPDTTAVKPTGGAQHEQLGLLQTATHHNSTQDTSKPGKPHLERAFLQSKKQIR